MANMWWNGKKRIKNKGWKEGCEEIENENDNYFNNTVILRHFSLESTSCITVLLNSAVSKVCGQGRSVGIAAGYGVDGPGIESRWGEIFRTCPDRPWGLPSLLYN